MKGSLLFILCFIFQFSLTAQPVQALKITPLVKNIYVFTTYHNYKGTSISANGVYLVTDSGVVMIDTPWDTTQFQPLLDSINEKHNKSVLMCIATHSHEDRTGGLEFMKQHGVKTFTTKQTDDISRVSNQKRAEYLLSGDTTFAIGQYKFETYYAGPGHTADNIVVWFGADKVLFGGCLIKSTDATDLGYIAEADLKAWPASIKNIQNRFTRPKYVIPGHDGWESSKGLQHTMTLLRDHQK